MQYRPKKRFAQHFLSDVSIIDKIIACLHAKPTDTFVEIGPGMGAITLPLLDALGKLHAVELDRDVIPHLQASAVSHGELILHEQDALKFDLHTVSRTPKSLRVVGNLPYNISTPLLFHFFTFSEVITDMYFMLQREVVQRMCAPPGSKTYGRLSVMLQYHAKPQALFDIPPQAFSPPPKVDSMFVRVTPHVQLPLRATDYKHFEALVTQAFSLRRKTIHNALKKFSPDAAFKQLEIDPQLRAENLSVTQFIQLSNVLL